MGAGMKMHRARVRHRRSVLARLRPGRAYSRGEIARETGLSPATVSRITRDLVRRRVLREVPESRGTSAGRPVRFLEVNGTYGRVLGISLLYPAARALVLDFRGEILAEEAREIEPAGGREAVLGPLRDLVRSVSIPRRRGAGRLIAAGLSIPGQWDRERGISIQYPRVGDWKDVPVRDLLAKWSGLPSFLVGYAPSLALAEYGGRSGEEPSGLLAVEVDENIALGVIVNGTLLEGASGNAGELGHITIDPEGPVCYCGNAGCLETLATCRAVVEGARRMEGGGGPRTYEDVVRRAEEGDPFSARLLERTAATLGMGLASAVNLFNPDVLVLNGRFFGAGSRVVEPLRESLRSHALPNSVRRLTIERSSLGPRAAALGAGIHAIGRVLQDL